MQYTILFYFALIKLNYIKLGYIYLNYVCIRLGLGYIKYSLNLDRLFSLTLDDLDRYLK